MFINRLLKCFPVILVVLPTILHAQPPTPGLDRVQGHACYTYGDSETVNQAKKAAVSLAQEEAVTTHRVYVQSATTVKNLQLEEDIVQAAGAAILEDTKIEKQEQNGREICVTITAIAVTPMRSVPMIAKT